MIENPIIAPYIADIEGTLDSIMGFSKELFLNLLSEIK